MNQLDKAIKSLQDGNIILLFDDAGRENEIDMIIHAAAVKPETIQLFRKDGGGLICLATDTETADKLGLPHTTDMMAASGYETLQKLCPEKTAYGDKPAFSMWINHKDTYTGIPDNDRALTITRFAEMIEQEKHDEFTEKFYAPGHVPTLIARDIKKRRGHTEMSIELAKKAGLSPALVLCEMMSDSCDALSIEDAKAYAEKHGLVILDGGDI